MKKVFQIALGVVAALGGFVDIGELVFDSQAGAVFGYQLLWTVPIGVVGIATYAEMCGRVATITKRPVFDVVRQRLGFGPGLVTGRLRRPFAYLVEGLGPDYMHVIPWREVTRVGTSVGLSGSAADLGLWTADGRNIQWVGAPPRGTIRVSELLRSRLVTGSGRDLGRIWDVRVERQTQVPDERVNEVWRVTGLIAGRGEWRERVGVWPERDPAQAEGFTPWDSVLELGDGTVTVSDPSA